MQEGFAQVDGEWTAKPADVDETSQSFQGVRKRNGQVADLSLSAVSEVAGSERGVGRSTRVMKNAPVLLRRHRGARIGTFR